MAIRDFHNPVQLIVFAGSHQNAQCRPPRLGLRNSARVIVTFCEGKKRAKRLRNPDNEPFLEHTAYDR